MKRIILGLAALVLGPAALNAEIGLPAVIGDNMVIQRDTRAALWGTASPGKKVTVSASWLAHPVTAVADRQTGKWTLRVQTPSAGGPYSITFSDGTPLTITNVMAGDVWFCSGQSNMEMPVRGFDSQPVEGSTEYIVKAKPSRNIRMHTVSKCSSPVVQESSQGRWECHTPDEVDAAQFAYMQDYINDMEASLYEDERFAAREFENYMDLQSFIDYYFVVELVQNNDACVPKSVFMHRDRGGKMVAGPVWDYDYGTFIKDPLMYLPDPDARRTGYNFMCQSCVHGHYYGQLMQDRQFKKLMQERWMSLRDDLATIPDFVDRTADYIRASEAINHGMWPIDSRTTSHDETLSFDEAVSRLKEAYTGKWEFLDGQISKWRF